jgi:hypothetical protein
MTNDLQWGRSDSNRDLRRLKVWSAADYATTPSALAIVAMFITHAYVLASVSNASALFRYSGPGGARILVRGSSNRC